MSRKLLKHGEAPSRGSHELEAPILHETGHGGLFRAIDTVALQLCTELPPVVRHRT